MATEPYASPLKYAMVVANCIHSLTGERQEPGAGDEISMSEPTSPTSSACCPAGRRCGRTFVDLGMSPLCESYVPPEKLNQMEPFYPLHAYVFECSVRS